MVSPATGIEDAGGDWYHEGGIILSKKPPEWHLSPPLHEFRVRFCYSLPQRRMVPPAAVVATTNSASGLFFIAAKKNGSACSGRSGNGLPRPIQISLQQRRTARRLQHRCCTEERPYCRMTVVGAGGDWYHEGGIILSKKPPEWRLSPPPPVVSHGQNVPAAPRGQPRAECPRRSTWSASGSDLIENNDKSPVA